MGGVINVRISKEIRAKMKKYDENWSEGIRHYIDTRLNVLELADALESSEKKVKHMKKTSDSTKLIREERELR